MSGICHKLAEWMRSPFSAVVYFQKHFVDDVADTVKRQKEQFDRHSREAQERAVQLHLDDLEAKYLCCVCGRPGEAREDDSAVYDTFSLVTLPARRNIEEGLSRAREVEEEEEREHNRESGGNAVDERHRQQLLRRRQRNRDREQERHHHRHHRRTSSAASGSHTHSASDRHRTPLSSRAVSALYDEDDDSGTAQSGSGDDPSFSPPSSRQETSSRPTRANTTVDFYGDGSAKGGGGGGNGGGSTDNVDGGENRDFPALDPELVPPPEVRNMMYKIQHAVLNREARTKRKAVHVHKDKGLTKIEESEIDMYSSFFQRPVHGFLCRECHTSARKRLDTVTEQIQSILFKAKHPFLRKVSEKEVNVLSSTGQLSAGLASSIFDIQRKWMRQQEATAIRATRLRQRKERAEGMSDAASTSDFADLDEHVADMGGEGDALLLGETGRPLRYQGGSATSAAAAGSATATLADATIISLRTTVKCAVCQRRQSCFFNRVSVLFLCQFCTARDRFYRERAVCINDEPMQTETVHLLTELAKYHEGVHRAQELRQLPQTELETAPTSLFNREESLFKIQTIAPQLLPLSAAVPPAAPVVSTMPLRDEKEKKREQLSRQTTSAGSYGGGGDSDLHRNATDTPGFTVDENGDVVRQPVLLKVEPRPYVDVQEMRRREVDVREVVGTTQHSLFENTRIEPTADMDLFAKGDSDRHLALSGQPQPPQQKPPAASVVNDLFGSPQGQASQPPPPTQDLNAFFTPPPVAPPQPPAPPSGPLSSTLFNTGSTPSDVIPSMGTFSSGAPTDTPTTSFPPSQPSQMAYEQPPPAMEPTPNPAAAQHRDGDKGSGERVLADRQTLPQADSKKPQVGDEDIAAPQYRDSEWM